MVLQTHILLYMHHLSCLGMIPNTIQLYASSPSSSVAMKGVGHFMRLSSSIECDLNKSKGYYG